MGISRWLRNIAITWNGSRWTTLSIGSGRNAIFHARVTVWNGRNGRFWSPESTSGARRSGHASAAAARAGLLRIYSADGLYALLDLVVVPSPSQGLSRFSQVCTAPT